MVPFRLAQDRLPYHERLVPLTVHTELVEVFFEVRCESAVTLR
jgi:hypothetical protein